MASTIHDNQKVFMEWLETCPVVDHKSIRGWSKTYDGFAYTVDFSISKLALYGKFEEHGKGRI